MKIPDSNKSLIDMWVRSLQLKVLFWDMLKIAA